MPIYPMVKNRLRISQFKWQLWLLIVLVLPSTVILYVNLDTPGHSAAEVLKVLNQPGFLSHENSDEVENLLTVLKDTDGKYNIRSQSLEERKAVRRAIKIAENFVAATKGLSECSQHFENDTFQEFIERMHSGLTDEVRGALYCTSADAIRSGSLSQQLDAFREILDSEEEASSPMAEKLEEKLYFRLRRESLLANLQAALDLISKQTRASTDSGKGVISRQQVQALIQDICKETEDSAACTDAEKSLIERTTLFFAKGLNLNSNHSRSPPSPVELTESLNSRIESFNAKILELNEQGKVINLGLINSPVLKPSLRNQNQINEQRQRFNQYQTEYQRLARDYLSSFGKGTGRLIYTPTYVELSNSKEFPLDTNLSDRKFIQALPQLPTVSPEQVRVMLNEAISMTKDNVRQLIKDKNGEPSQEEKRKRMAEIILTQPKAVARVLMKNPQLTPTYCEAMKRWVTEEDDKQYQEAVLATAGLGLGGVLLLTGIGSASGAAIIAATTAATGVAAMEFNNTIHRYQQSTTTSEALLGSLFSGTSDSDTLLEIQEAGEEADDAFNEIVTTLALSPAGVAGAVVGRAVGAADRISMIKKMGSFAKRLRQFEDNSPLEGYKILAGGHTKREEAEWVRLLSSWPKESGQTSAAEKLLIQLLDLQKDDGDNPFSGRHGILEAAKRLKRNNDLTQEQLDQVVALRQAQIHRQTSASDLERRIHAASLINKHYQISGQPDGRKKITLRQFQQMLEGVLKAHYSSNNPYGQLTTEELRKLSKTLKEHGIDNSQLRRDLIVAGVTGRTAGTSAFRTPSGDGSFQSLINDKEVKFNRSSANRASRDADNATRRETSTIINLTPEQIKAKLSSLQSDPEADPIEIYRLRKKLGSLENPSGSTSYDVTRILGRPPQSTWNQTLNQSNHFQSDGLASDFNQLLKEQKGSLSEAFQRSSPEELGEHLAEVMIQRLGTEMNADFNTRVREAASRLSMALKENGFDPSNQKVKLALRGVERLDLANPKNVPKWQETFEALDIIAQNGRTRLNNKEQLLIANALKTYNARIQESIVTEDMVKQHRYLDKLKKRLEDDLKVWETEQKERVERLSSNGLSTKALDSPQVRQALRGLSYTRPNGNLYRPFQNLTDERYRELIRNFEALQNNKQIKFSKSEDNRIQNSVHTRQFNTQYQSYDNHYVQNVSSFKETIIKLREDIESSANGARPEWLTDEIESFINKASATFLDFDNQRTLDIRSGVLESFESVNPAETH